MIHLNAIVVSFIRNYDYLCISKLKLFIHGECLVLIDGWSQLCLFVVYRIKKNNEITSEKIQEGLIVHEIIRR